MQYSECLNRDSFASFAPQQMVHLRGGRDKEQVEKVQTQLMNSESDGEQVTYTHVGGFEVKTRPEILFVKETLIISCSKCNLFISQI